MMGFIKSKLLLIIVLILAAGAVFFLSSCTLFQKEYAPTVWEKNLPPECNMSLNAYKLYYNSNDKSATVPPSDFCFKKLHRLFCQEEVFGRNIETGILNPVDYENNKLYRNYEQCKAELK